jgi:hypothetical protein
MAHLAMREGTGDAGVRESEWGEQVTDEASRAGPAIG